MEKNGKRAHEIKLIKKNEAEERQRLSGLRNPKEQLQRLDTRFGKDLGAKKERARLLRKIVDIETAKIEAAKAKTEKAKE